MCLAAGRLGFVNVVNIEEIPNVITNQSVHLFPLGIYPSTLLDLSWNESKYVQYLN